MRHRHLPLPLAALLLAACQGAPPPAPAGAPAAFPTFAQAKRGASIVLKPSFVTAAPRRLLADVVPNTVSSINHMVVELWEVPGGVTPDILQDDQDIPATDLLNTLTFGNLKSGTNYRIQAYAYATGDTSAKISIDADSDLPFSVGADEAPSVGTLVVTLTDTPFAAAATGGVTIADGILEHDGGLSTAKVNQPIAFDKAKVVLGMTPGTGFGAGLAAAFAQPRNLAVDAAGAIYVADSGNHRILKIPTGATSVLFAGTTGTDGGAPDFAYPQAMAFDGGGFLWVADGSEVKKIAPNGAVTRVAGVFPLQGTADGTANGSGTDVMFDGPRGLAFAPDGKLYVADTNNHRIRLVEADGDTTTFAGSSSGFEDATGTAAKFKNPGGIAVARDGTIYVADTDNYCIRRIHPTTKAVTIFAGTAETSGQADGAPGTGEFVKPGGLAFDKAGHLYVADGVLVRKVDPFGNVRTVAGDGTAGPTAVGGAFGALTVQFTDLSGIARGPDGSMFVVAGTDHRVTKIFKQ